MTREGENVDVDWVKSHSTLCTSEPREVGVSRYVGLLGCAWGYQQNQCTAGGSWSPKSII